MFLHPGGGGLNRLDDLVISGAAAHDAFDPFPDLLLAGLRILLQQGINGHDHARRAVAALDGSCFYIGFLNGMEVVPFGPAPQWSRPGLLPLPEPGSRQLLTAFPFNDDRAVPALSLSAALLRPG